VARVSSRCGVVAIDGGRDDGGDAVRDAAPLGAGSLLNSPDEFGLLLRRNLNGAALILFIAHGRNTPMS
jgi:hypothetical protein